MYLASLSFEEKNLFLELAVTIASADGNFCAGEKEMVQAYCDEMQIMYDDDMKTHSLDEIISALKNCRDQSKKIILYELIGLVMVDGKEDPAETAIIKKIQTAFNFSDDLVQQCKTVLLEYISLQEKINTLILK